MNIFVLDQHPETAAKMQHDKHVVKMVLESTQMLCSAFDVIHKPPYKRAYFNHPCTIWARTSEDNYRWLLLHGLSLAYEYKHRYNKTHASQKVLGWCWNNYKSLIEFPQSGLTKHVTAMPDKYKEDDAVASYIKYYIGEKLTGAKYTNRVMPQIFYNTIKTGALYG